MQQKFSETIKVIQEFGNAVISSYKDKLKSDGNAGSKLFTETKFKIKSGNYEWSVLIDLPEYWKYVEYGRKPGKFPPPDKIRSWITAKKIIPRPLQLKSGKTVLPSISQLTFLISRSIARNGISPKPYLSNSIETAKAEYIEKIKEAIIRDLTSGPFQ